MIAGLFSSGPSRRVTYNQNGVVKDELAPTRIMHNGTNIRKVGVDGVILISPDAASKITETAIGLAFDKWAADILKDWNEKENQAKPPERQKKPSSRKSTTKMSNTNANTKKVPSKTAVSDKRTKSPTNRQ